MKIHNKKWLNLYTFATSFSTVIAKIHSYLLVAAVFSIILLTSFDSLKNKAIHKKVYTPPRFSMLRTSHTHSIEILFSTLKCSHLYQTNTNDLQMLVYLTNYASSVRCFVLFYKHKLSVDVRPKSAVVWRIVRDRERDYVIFC